MSREQPSMGAAQAGVLSYLVRNVRLSWRLLRDPRVALASKIAIPVITAAYLLSPADFLPDLIPVLGQLDDLAILALAMRLFIQLAPAEAVKEHTANLAAGRSRRASEEQVVDGDYRVRD